MSPFARSLQKNSPESFGALVGEGGFGPPKLKSNRFTVCPLWPLGNSPIKIQKIYRSYPVKNGAGGRTRTPDLLITNQLLYQLSYTSLTDLIIIPQTFSFVKPFLKFFKKNFFCCFESCRLIVQYVHLLGVVEATGLEPAASWSQTKHSTKLSYASEIISRDSFYIIAKIRFNVKHFSMICIYAHNSTYSFVQK